MNTDLVLLQINSAISVFERMAASIEKLPEYRKIDGAIWIYDAIRRLEVAKAEVQGQPLPTPPVADVPADFDFIAAA